MTTRFAPGGLVQTAFGKGIVREVRNRGRLLVEVHGRSLVLKEGDVAPLAAERPPARPARAAAPEAVAPTRGGGGRSHRQMDLHGLTVEQALARAEEALNDAILADASELRLIHGRSGGRIRAALHAWLRRIASVSFRIDPDNTGVTIVSTAGGTAPRRPR